ncbi:solute carrier family 2, facilitated glucose transporter member 11-like [Latimeria chalumnae]|uniref:solute carrier family 2, facilitated glucose transporter member 11-like n=1 Tax=Latimeria chalumnae TaxID=7897 RepID=UPI00313F2847
MSNLCSTAHERVASWRAEETPQEHRLWTKGLGLSLFLEKQSCYIFTSEVIKPTRSTPDPQNTMKSELLQRPRLVIFTIVLGIGGTFQHGFNIAVISAPSPYIKDFINSTWLERYGSPLGDKTMKLTWSIVVSIYAVGGLFGAFSAKPLSRKLGRKKCLLCNNIITIISAIITGLSKTAKSFEMIFIGRILYGFIAGISICVQTMYLVESAPKKLRGIITMTSAAFISIGKVWGQIIGLREMLGTENLWPVLLAFSGLPALIQLLTLPFFPESPRYLLVDKGEKEKCMKALEKLWGRGDYRAELDEMVKERALNNGEKAKSILELFTDRSVRWQLLITVVMSGGLHLSGVMAIYFYASDVFFEAGVEPDKINYVAIGTGACEIVGVMFCGYFLDRAGRKALLWKGYGTIFLLLVLLTLTTSLQNQVYWMPYCSIILIILFIIFFIMGPGSVTSLLLTEIFLQSFRPAAVMIGTSIGWSGIFLVGMVFPFLVSVLGRFSFLVFSGLCFLSAVFAFTCVPETKDKTLMEITEEFNRRNFRGPRDSKTTTPAPSELVLSTRL